MSFQTKFVLGLAVAAEHQEPAGAVDVERVVHWMVLIHLVGQADLDPVTDSEGPGDAGVLGPGLLVDQLPDHVARVRLAVDLGHQVFPFEPVSVVMGVLVALVLGVLTLARARNLVGRDQLHPALGTARCFRVGDLGMHRADV